MPIFGEILEIILKPRMFNFLDKNNLSSPKQFGFSPGG